MPKLPLHDLRRPVASSAGQNHPAMAVLLKRIAQSVVMASTVGTVGCSSSHQDVSQSVPTGGTPVTGGVQLTGGSTATGGSLATDSEIEPGKRTLVPCGGQDLIAGLQAPALVSGSAQPQGLGIAYVSLREPASETSINYHDSEGTPCGTADSQQCEAVLIAAAMDYQTSILLYGAVNGVLTVATGPSDALNTLLGPIDTMNEAALLAWVQGHFVNCETIGRSTVLPAASAEKVEGGYLVHYTVDICASPVAERTILVEADGTISEIGSTKLGATNCLSGRRPAGLLSQHSTSRRPNRLGDYLADNARLEAASVVSFVRIAAELKSFSAPDELMRRALEAANDEVRHAQQMARLCRHFGSEPLPAEVTPATPRSLFEFALDNAIEGCVRETFGAILGHVQAMTALDSAVREVMVDIAADETRHAVLSHDMARYVEPLLTSQQRTLLHNAQVIALAQLDTELDTGLNAGERAAIGFPDVATSARLLQTLSSHLI